VATLLRAAAGSVSDKPVTHTVQDFVGVVPGPLRIVLIALLLLSLVLGGGYLLTAARARRLTRQRADLLQEVGLLQTALLPPVPATVGALRTSVAYQPSDGPAAGGDFYDALTLPGGKAAFILGDVCGHGRQALARTAFMRYTLRAYLEAGLEPRRVLNVAGGVIDEHLGGEFATVVIAVHDPHAGTLTYACAGHPAPIIAGATRHEPILAGSSPPIGLGLRTGMRQTTVPLPPGSVACLYTDGLAEARTERGILGRPRLGDLVAELGRNATAPALLDLVAEEARLVTDDMATVVMTPTAGVTTGGFRDEQLEVDEEDEREELPRRFLEACSLPEERIAELLPECTALVGAHRGAVLHVRFGARGPQAEVLPRNVESLEGASLRALAMAR
jgi:stage II sporulation SpoE-like protein